MSVQAGCGATKRHIFRSTTSGLTPWAAAVETLIICGCSAELTILPRHVWIFLGGTQFRLRLRRASPDFAALGPARRSLEDKAGTSRSKKGFARETNIGASAATPGGGLSGNL